MKLYTYYRSSAVYRVRIALNLKALDYESVSVSLGDKENAMKALDYFSINPQGFVPALEDNGQIFTQSLAIIEYLDEEYPDISLLPTKPKDRAVVRAMAQMITSDVHPLNNLRVLNYLRDQLKQPEESINAWYKHWIQEAFAALETMVEQHGGAYCFKDTISLADVCLVPQMANAKRMNVDISPFSKLREIDEVLSSHPAFIDAAPEAQADAPADSVL
ncbi:maleylacetoacetate isomerase [Aurantivibrio plasticivorans]